MVYKINKTVVPEGAFRLACLLSKDTLRKIGKKKPKLKIKADKGDDKWIKEACKKGIILQLYKKSINDI